MNDYLITFSDGRKPFLSKWYSYENNWIEGMVVYDLYDSTYTLDGINWIDIIEDTL